MRFLLSCLTAIGLLLVMSGIALSEPEGLKEFLDSRKVVAAVYFDYGSSDLNADARAAIEQHIGTIRKAVDGGQIVRVEGFCSPEGKQKANFRLSLHRARSVSEFLSSNGMKSTVEITGFGSIEAGKIAPDKERRVDIALYEQVIDLTPLRSRTEEKGKE